MKRDEENLKFFKAYAKFKGFERRYALGKEDGGVRQVYCFWMVVNLIRFYTKVNLCKVGNFIMCVKLLVGVYVKLVNLKEMPC